MSGPRHGEWRAWGLVVLWIVVLYGMVPVARRIQAAVERASGRVDVFLYSAAIAGICAWILAMAWLWRVRPPAAGRGFAWLTATAVLFWVGLVRLTGSPVEGLHFVEYGVLGALLYRAFVCRVRDRMVYGVVVLAGSVVGLVDEALQWLTPERVWDLRDVGINCLAVVLVQAAIAGGLRPAATSSPVPWSSVRVACRVGAVLCGLLALCMAGTPAHIEWLGTHVPGLGFLRGKAGVMTEYGYRHQDPVIGTFYSRFSLAELRRLDRERGEEAGQVLNAWRQHEQYPEFLQRYPPGVDPFIHEARVHLFRRDHHLGLLWPDNWDAPINPALTEPEIREAATVLVREHQLMKAYFPNTLACSGCDLPEDLLAAARERMDPQYRYVSAVSRHLITWVSQRGLVGALTVAALVLALAGWLPYRGRAQPAVAAGGGIRRL